MFRNHDKKSNKVLNASLLISIPIAVIVVLISGIIYSLQIQNEKTINKNLQKDFTTLVYKQMALNLSSITSDLMILSESQTLQNYFSSKEKMYLKQIMKEYLVFSQRKRLYDQIRYLDNQGKEIVRVNFNSGNPDIIDDTQLQNKGKRYYFKDTVKLGKGEIFVSPFDLNIENGKIETPLKPMIRFGTPVFDNNGKNRGIVLLNYLGENLITNLKQLNEGRISRVMLLNSDGFWIKGLDKEKEWGFMYDNRKDDRFGVYFPVIWQQIKENNSFQMENKEGLFTSMTIYPFKESLKSSTGSRKPFNPSSAYLSGKQYHWKIVSYVPKDLLTLQSKKILIPLILLNMILFVIIGIGSWLISRAFVHRKKIEENLEKAKKELDQRVKERTFQLFEMNTELEKEIGERILAEKSVRLREEQYRGMVESSPDAIISTDENARIIHWNSAAANIFEYSSKEALGKSADIIIPEKYKKQHAHGVSRFNKTGKTKIIGKTIEIEGLKKNHEIVPIEMSLSAFQKSGKWTFTSIIRDISERKTTQLELLRNHDTQKVINLLLRKSAGNDPIKTILEECLDLILSLPWLTIESKGCIFLLGNEKDILVMKAQRGLGPEVLGKCRKVSFGSCLCGRAAIEKKPVFASHIDDRHDIFFESMEDHGHYCVPILSEGNVLGIVNIYLNAGHIRDENEVNFLNAVANALAGIIIRRHVENEKINLQRQIQQAHKMESVGTLAGGIAHDFNNILFPIIGYTEMLLTDVPKDSPLRDSLNPIYSGALRAKGLVKQILTFSRQDKNELMLMKMQPIIREALKLIRATISSTIEIKQKIDSDCGAIKADPTQIHQIVMNLSTNAYHAMEKTGGVLKVILKEIQLGEYDIITPDMIPGVYVCLTVSDTGKGMDKELTQKIFDPFFTTKGIGKGTGMGLSVVHGIVNSLGGTIHVYSEPGKGTKFNVYFPGEKKILKEQTNQDKQPIQGGTEQILLVDDEESIILMETRMLKRLGYLVTSRTSSLEALEAFRAKPDKFDLIITDMAMPNMPGDKLSAELTKIRPDIPILLCTGFSETMSEEKAASIGIKGFLLKPIVMRDLAQKMRDVLDENKN